jgi:hypothetical protein
LRLGLAGALQVRSVGDQCGRECRPTGARVRGSV